jgi:hypothetical protein
MANLLSESPVSASQAERRFVNFENSTDEVGLALSADWKRPERSKHANLSRAAKSTFNKHSTSEE